MLVLAIEAIAASGAETAAQPVWLISTRNAPRCGDLEAGLEQIAYWQLEEGTSCQWLRKDAEAFRSHARAVMPTTVFIHGYRIGPDAAVEEASALCHHMKREACGRPFRLIIWSWPSDRSVRRVRADAQMKASWSDTESYYLARILPDVSPGTPLGLIGYSFGARVIGGTLQLLAGGEVAGRTLPAEPRAAWASGRPRPVRAMLLAAAMDADWLAPCHPEGLSLPMVERVLVTENCCDRVLKWYSRLYGRGGPQALGRVGPAGPDGGKFELVEVACEVGKRHDWYNYLAASAVAQRLAWYTHLAD